MNSYPDSRGSIMFSLHSSSRPDERKREQAKKERANQVKPFPPSPEKSCGDNTFEPVPLGQQDDLYHGVQEVLGPYINVLSTSSLVGGKANNNKGEGRLYGGDGKDHKRGTGPGDNLYRSGQSSKPSGNRPSSSNQLKPDTGQQYGHNHKQSSSLGPSGQGGVGDAKPTSSLSSSLSSSQPSSSSSTSKPQKRIPYPERPNSLQLHPGQSHSPSCVKSCGGIGGAAGDNAFEDNASSSSGYSSGSSQIGSVTTPPPPAAASSKLKERTGSTHSPFKDAKPPHSSHNPAQVRPRVPSASSNSTHPASSSHSSSFPSSRHSRVVSPNQPRNPSISSSVSSSITSGSGGGVSKVAHPKVSSGASSGHHIVSPLSPVPPVKHSSGAVPQPSVAPSSLSSSSSSSSVPSTSSSTPSSSTTSLSSTSATITKTNSNSGTRPSTPVKTKSSRLPNGLAPSSASALSHSKTTPSSIPRAPIPTSSSSSSTPSSSSATASSTKLSSTAPDPADSQSKSSASSTEKSKLAKLIIPGESKVPSSKSDLNDIVKEFSEVQPLHTAIQTPHKAGNRFPFQTLSSLGFQTADPVEPLENSPSDEEVKESSGKAKVKGAADGPSTKPATKDEANCKPHQEKPVVVSASPKKLETIEPRKERVASKTLEDDDSDDGVTVVKESDTIASRHPTSSRGKSIEDPSSILQRDLNLSSEDSDADQLSEDNKTSANQSKKGKVMESASRPAGKRTPRMSSSSSSSSDSSSDSGGDDDDDESKVKATTIGGKAVAGYEEEKAGKGTTSTSNSSSSSSSESVTEDEEEEEGEDEEEERQGRPDPEVKKEKMDTKTAVERGEKTPSPQAKQPVSTPSATPNPAIQETGESGLNWSLGNFINASKKSLSPASASPFKSPSPAASISHRDETGSMSGKHIAKESGKAEEDRPGSAADSKPVRSLKEIGHTTTMPFDMADSEDEDMADDLRDNNKNLVAGNSDGDDEDEAGSSRTKWSSSPKKKKTPTKESKHRVPAQSSKVVDSLDISGKTTREDDSWKQSEAKKKPSPGLKAKMERGKHTPSPNKKRRPKNISCSTSEDEIVDVVNFTPDEKGQHRSPGVVNKGVNKKRKEEVTKTLFRNHSSDSEREESSRPVSISDRQSPSSQKKPDWHKVRPQEPISPLSSPQAHPSPSHSLPITPRKLVGDSSMALNHLESICKPVNLLSPLRSGCSPSPSSSTRPLPSFHKSFSPAPQSAAASGSPAPIVTVSSNGEPQIVVRIRLNAVTEKRLNRLKERKSRKSSAARKLSSSSDANVAPAVASSSEPRLEPDVASKGHRVPPIGGVVTSQPVDTRDSAETGSSGSSRKISSSSSLTTPGSSSKPLKRKSIDPGGEGHPPPSSSSSSSLSSSSSMPSSASHSPSVSSSNPFHKLPKSSKTSSKEAPPLPPPVPSSSSSSMRSSSPSLSSNVSHSASGSLIPSEATSDESSAMSSLKKSNNHHHYHQHHSSNSKKTPPYSDAGSSGQKRTSSSNSNSYSISAGSGGGGAAKNLGDFGPTENANNKTDPVAPRSERPTLKDSSKGLTHSESKSLKRRSGETLSAHEEESSSSSFKRVKSDPIHAAPSSKPEVDKANNGHGATTPDAATGIHRRDSNASSSSRSSHKSLSKKSRRPSSNNNNNNSDKNSIDSKVNHPDPTSLNNRDLPFNHYVNGTALTSSSSASNSNNTSSGNNSNAAAACGYSNSRGPPIPGLPPHLPLPSPIETQLKSMDQYMCRAKEHKHRGDGSDDHMEKIECYLRGCLNFFLAGYTMEQNRNGGYRLYEETFSLLQFAIRRAGDNSDSHSSDKDRDRERKFIVLMTRLQALLNLRMYRLRKGESEKFKKIIDAEQARPTPPAPVHLPSNSSSNKPHAPSPHQSSWNKNSTGTPSPMSPTPSPGSVSSQGSCELMTGKIPNGTAGGGTSSSSVSMINSPSPCMVTIPQRLHAVMHKYINLTDPLVKATDLWDQATADSRGLEEFFLILDNACGPLSFNSEPLFVVRYMKYALRLLCDVS